MFTQTHGESTHDVAGAALISDASDGRVAPRATTGPGSAVSQFGSTFGSHGGGGGGRMTEHGTCQRPPATTSLLGLVASATWPKNVVSGSGFCTSVQLRPAGYSIIPWTAAVRPARVSASTRRVRLVSSEQLSVTEVSPRALTRSGPGVSPVSMSAVAVTSAMIPRRMSLSSRLVRRTH